MSILKAFARGFAEGWRKGFTFDGIVSGLIHTGGVILIWEWFNGRLFT